MFSAIDIKNGFVPYPQERAKLYTEQGCWQAENHFQFLHSVQKKYANNIALQQGDKSLTYAELFSYAISYGKHLNQQGIQEGDYILLQSPNVIEFFVVLFGLYSIGARPVFCLNGHGAYEIENIAKISRAVGYIKINEKGHDEPDAIDMSHQFSRPNLHLWYRQTIVSEAELKLSLPMLEDISKKAESLTDPTYDDAQAVTDAISSIASGNDIAFIQLSGGTTGLPKLIARTHSDYLYSVKLSAQVAQLNENTKQLVVLPTMHNFIMSSPGFLGCFYVGGTVVLNTDSSPKACFELIERYGITQVSLVPALANLWINSPFLAKYDLSSLSVIQVGGSKLLPELAQQIITKLAVTLQQVYGMAEGLVNFTRLDDDEQTIIHTQGQRLSPLDEIRIVDNEENPLPHEVTGHIQTRGPYTINGYYNLDDANQHSFTADGFYKTGDMGYLDHNNNIVVTGRAKEQINRAGEKITPSEIENLLLPHPAIKNVCILGVDDPILGERSKALIILKEEQEAISLKEIRVFLMEKNIAQYKIPDEVEIVSDFQYTHVGKIHTQKLKHNC